MRGAVVLVAVLTAASIVPQLAFAQPADQLPPPTDQPTATPPAPPPEPTPPPAPPPSPEPSASASAAASASASAPATEKTDEVKPEGGFFPKGGFVLRSSDEAFKLRLRLQSAIRASVRINGKAQLANPFMTLRPVLEGNLYKKWIRFWTSLELAANPVYLLDSYVEIEPVPEFGIRAGQQWTIFSRHEAIYGPGQLLLPEWSPVADYFWPGRDKGITLYGATAEGKIDYSLGAYMGSPLRSFQPIRGNYQLMARFGVSPNGPVGSEYAYAEPGTPDEFRYAIGVNAVTSKVDQGAENFNPSTFKFEVTPTGETKLYNMVGADVLIQTPVLMASAEGYMRRTDPHAPGPDFTSIGGFAQAGVLVYKHDVDLVARFNWVDVNYDADHDTAIAIEGGGNYYIHAPWVIFRLRYAYGSQRTPTEGVGATSSGGAPLIISPGTVHVITAQINTTF